MKEKKQKKREREKKKTETQFSRKERQRENKRISSGIVKAALAPLYNSSRAFAHRIPRHHNMRESGGVVCIVPSLEALIRDAVPPTPQEMDCEDTDGDVAKDSGCNMRVISHGVRVGRCWLGTSLG